MPITLIGYRGTGKSTVGPLLARRLGWEAVDADQEIERRAGKCIAAIFAEDGEPFFRRLEAECLADLLHRPRCVVAAGGGAVLDSGTRLRMRQAGPVVWLTAGIPTILARIGGDVGPTGTRPSLTDLPVAEEIAALLARREPLYEDAATLTVSTDGRAAELIVEEILRRLPSLEGEP